MKCLQCEDRIQQLLDDRVDPRFDAQVQQHVELCSTCRLMLGFYACLDQSVEKTKNVVRNHGGLPLPVPLQFHESRHVTRSRQPGFPLRQNRQLILSVAIVMLVLVGAAIFAPMPSATTTPVARGSRATIFPAPSGGINETGGANETVARQTTAINNRRDLLSDWIPTRFPNLSDVRFNTWGEVDLVSFVPRMSVDTVRGFPVALESVAPIYRYSSELPVVSQWANGISYTLSLLRARFLIISPSTPQVDDGFGSFLDVERSLTC